MNILRIRRKSNKKNAHKKFLLLVIFLIMTTFAWFTYYKALGSNFNFHIASWDVEYTINGVKQSTPLKVNAQSLYPGMEEQRIVIDVKNNGELDIDLNYSIASIKMIGKTYDIIDPDQVIIGGEETAESENEQITLGNRVSSNGITKQDIINEKLRFPFKITIESIEKMSAGQDGGQIIITITWPDTDETNPNKDELDSKWGYEFAKYFTSIETEEEISAIEILIPIEASQQVVEE